MCEICGCDDKICEHDTSGRAVIDVEKDVLARNDLLAARNRGYFAERGIFCLNMMSSPGAGKTTLLEKTIIRLKQKIAIYVIEGDQQTDNDAQRIAAQGVPAFQINMGAGCHLEADSVYQALEHLNPQPGSLLFIENVGNLICPAMFDLGEAARVVITSVTEGDDKPLKYPHMFQMGEICLINKIDLLPYLHSDINVLRENLRKVNPRQQIFEVSASSGAGLDDWCAWLLKKAVKV
jgi:hydrogenase nickel incorporation protein HypB